MVFLFQKVASLYLIAEVVFAMIFAFAQWYPANSSAAQKVFQLCFSEVDFFIANGINSEETESKYM